MDGNGSDLAAICCHFNVVHRKRMIWCMETDVHFITEYFLPTISTFQHPEWFICM